MRLWIELRQERSAGDAASHHAPHERTVDVVGFHLRFLAVTRDSGSWHVPAPKGRNINSPGRKSWVDGKDDEARARMRERQLRRNSAKAKP